MAARLGQGRLGYCGFTPAGGSQTLIPVYDWHVTARRNRVTGDPVGNTWSTNYADGMLTSRFRARIMLRATTGEAWATSFIDNFITRAISDANGSQYGLDDTIGYSIAASDGTSLYSLANCKPEQFSLTVAKGSPVGMDVDFVCPGGPTITAARYSTLTSAYAKTVNSSKLLMYNAATFWSASNPAGLSGSSTQFNPYNFQMTFANNHIVNAPLDGTLGAASFDAGLIRAGASFTLAAHHGLTGDLAPFSTDQAIRLLLSLGSGNQVTFDMSSVVPDTDLDGSATTGASFRTWQCMVLGIGGSSPLAPIVLGR